MGTFVHKVLSINLNLQELNNRLEVLQSKSSHRFETLIGICARLYLVDQIRIISCNEKPLSDCQEILYQIDRTSVYLTTTCIDVLTGGHYQQYDQWLIESYNNCMLGENWDSAIDELSKSQTPTDTANSFIKWTKKLHDSDYKETMSIRQAFKCFICTADDWMKKWLYQYYIVEDLNSDFKPKILWEDLSEDKKCKNIAVLLTIVPFTRLTFFNK